MPENTIDYSDLTGSSKQKPGSPRPGALRSQVTMEIQTILAQRLVHGRERAEGVEPIIGAIEFGRRTRALWESSENDDPYADWYLLKIEESIESAKQLIDDHSRKMKEILTGMEAFDIKIANSIEPIEVPLQFGNPYGYMGAYLVADYDVFCRTALTARHLGLIDRNKSEESLKAVGRAIRRIFSYVGEWRFTGVNRDDLGQMNQNARRAQELMGELPPEVLSGEKRARMAPAINPRPNRTSADTGNDEDGQESDGTGTGEQDQSDGGKNNLSRYREIESAG